MAWRIKRLCAIFLLASFFSFASAQIDGSCVEAGHNDDGCCTGTDCTGVVADGAPTCFCDISCYDFGDCCSDIEDIGCLSASSSCEAAGHVTCCTDIDCVGVGGSDTCYCDVACYDFGDCCSDIDNTCPLTTDAPTEPPPEGSCAANYTECCDALTCYGEPKDSGCYCDQLCYIFNDCCNDIAETCTQADIGNEPYLLFANLRNISRINLDGTSLQTLVFGEEGAAFIGMDYNYRMDDIFWSDLANSSIKRSNLNGSDVSTIINTGLETVDGLAVDWITNKLYWTDAFYAKIDVFDVERSLRKNLIFTGVESIARGIAVDPSTRWMYWTDWGTPAKIEKASMDGSNRTVLHDTNLTWPNGITLDYDAQVVYWIDAFNDVLEFSNVDGTNRQVLQTHALAHPFGLTLYDKQLYWTDWTQIAIITTRKGVGDTVSEIVNGLPNFPMAIEVVTSDRQADVEVNPCSVNNGGCSDLCLLSINSNGYSCDCPEGSVLLDNQKDCMVVPTTTPTPDPSFGSCVAAGLTDCCNASSCFGFPANCFCDEMCYIFDDCCHDIDETCPQPTTPAPTTEPPGPCEAAGFDECCTGVSCFGVGSPITCYCDEACHGFGDCCSDIDKTCPLVTTPPPEVGPCEAAGFDECCTGTSCFGDSPTTCYCDLACYGFNDCCSDINETCPQPTTPPPVIGHCADAGYSECCEGGNCTGLPLSSGCFCDEECFILDDCCSDINSTCVPGVIGNEPYLLFANIRNISRINLDGTSLQTLVFGEEGAAFIGMDYNYRMNDIFWSDIANNSIKQSNLNGSNVSVIVNTGLETVDGLTVDWITNKLYWTDAFYAKIDVFDVERSIRKNLIFTGVDSIARGIAVDPSTRWMYWTDWGTPAKIEKASMDGSNRTVLHDTNLTWPNGITLDYAAQVVYWIDAFNDVLEFSNVDGTNRQVLQTQALAHPFGLTLYDKQLYWTDWAQIAIITTRKGVGDTVTEIINGLPNFPMAIEVVTSDRQADVEVNPCSVDNGGCSDLCLLSINSNGFSCDCAEGSILLDNQTDCMVVPTMTPTPHPSFGSCVTAGFTDCCNASSCFGFPANCFCDEACFNFDDCCYDIQITCPQPTTPPPPVGYCVDAGYSECCEGDNCTGLPLNAQCFCDEECFILNDCCSDINSTCLPGVIGNDPYLLFANQYAINRINLNGSSFETIVLGEEGAAFIGMDYNYRMDNIFWSDVVNNTIKRSSLNGSDVSVIVNTGLETVDGLAVDWITNKLYWTDAYYAKIDVFDVERSLRKNLIFTGVESIARGIAVNPSTRWMYWTDWGNPAKIEKGSMDGSNRTVLHDTNLVWPNGITLDYEAHVVYWIDAFNDVLEFSNVDGTNRQVLQTQALAHPFGLTLYDKQLYWTDWTQIAIITTRKGVGDTVTEIVNGLPDFPMAIEVVTSDRQADVEVNPCSFENGGCSDLCLLSINSNGYSCDCPEGSVLLDNQKDCMDNETISTTPPPTGSCVTAGFSDCCDPTIFPSCLGFPANCFCDEACFLFEDCCYDIDDICPAVPTSTPTQTPTSTPTQTPTSTPTQTPTSSSSSTTSVQPTTTETSSSTSTTTSVEPTSTSATGTSTSSSTTTSVEPTSTSTTTSTEPPSTSTSTSPTPSPSPTEPPTVPGPVTGLTVTSIDSSKGFLIQWQPPSGALTKYQIMVTLVDGSNVINEEIDAPVSTYRTDLPELPDLQTFVPYEVSVRAATAAGYGPYATIIGFTKEGAPLVAPSGFTATRKSGREIAASWNELSLFEARGFVIGYRITYESTPNRRQALSVNVPGNQTSVVVGGLDPELAYSLTVSGITIAGVGLPSDPIIGEATTSSLFQLLLTGNIKCETWREEEKDAKLEDIKTALAENIECACGFSALDIAEEDLYCYTDENAVTFRAKLYGNNQATSTEIRDFISQWVQGESTVKVGGDDLTVNKDCPVEIKSYDEEGCKLQGGTSTANPVTLVVGVTVPIVLILIVAIVIVIIVIFMFTKKTHKVNDGDTDAIMFDDAEEGEFIHGTLNINTARNVALTGYEPASGNYKIGKKKQKKSDASADLTKAEEAAALEAVQETNIDIGEELDVQPTHSSLTFDDPLEEEDDFDKQPIL